MKPRQFQKGDTIRLKNSVIHTYPKGRENNRTAKILSFLDGIYEGGIFTDRDLKGCRYWNIEDVELVKESMDNK